MARRRKQGIKSKPPQYVSQPIMRRKMRYVASGVQSSFAVTARKLALSLGTVCATSNTTVWGFVGAVRIRSIQMWVGTATSGTQANCLVNFLSSQATSGIASMNKEVGDDTINASELAYISARPPAGTQASFWQTAASTDTLCLLTCSANCVMDIEMDYILSDNENVGMAQYTITSGTAVVGNVYYINLSGSSTGFSPYLLSTNY